MALGLCASMASGLKAQFGTMAKPLNAGLAARTGVEAALWAQAGMTATQDGLAGPLGFGPTHFGMEGQVTLPKRSWNILSISHKFHACCHGLHAMLEALGQAKLAPQELEALHIRTHPRWMSVCNIENPKTGLAAKFSYRQTAAMCLLGHATNAIENFTDEITQDPAVAAQRGKIRVSADAALTETQAELSATLKGGAIRRFKHDLLAPMVIEKRARKLREKAAALISAERAEALWGAVQGNELQGLRVVLAGT